MQVLIFTFLLPVKAQMRIIMTSIIMYCRYMGLPLAFYLTSWKITFWVKVWSPLSKVMAEAGFDYKKGLGSFLDSNPWYFHFKFGVPEGENAPAFAVGAYDMGTRSHRTNYNIWYFKAAKTLDIGNFNLGRISLGYFLGNPRLLKDKNSLRDHHGALFTWERTMFEISDKLWLCVDYQGTQSAYGAINYGFAWKLANNISAIVGYDIYNNRNLADTITFQLDVDF